MLPDDGQKLWALIQSGQLPDEIPDKTRADLIRIPEFIAGLDPATFAEVFECPSPSLALAKRFHGEKITQVVVETMLLDLARFFNLTNTLNGQQATSIARLMIRHFHYLKLADLSLVFDLIKIGEFGPMYARLDGGTIFEAVRKYCERREEAASVYSEERHQKSKNELGMVNVEVAQRLINRWQQAAKPKIQETENRKWFVDFRHMGDWSEYTGGNVTEKIGELRALAETEYNELRETETDFNLIEFDDFMKLKVNQFLFEESKKARQQHGK